MARPTQSLLSRELIVRTALDMVRREHQFTVPGLATRLKVHPSSLYHHVPGGRGEIVDLMRKELYAGIDLDRLTDSEIPWEVRLQDWTHSYRLATAGAPWLVPVVVGQPVEDAPTQAIYEALFALLDESGLPESKWMAAATMFDVIVLGSALDASSPVPLWQNVDSEFSRLSGPMAAHDTEERKIDGFAVAVDAAIAWVQGQVEG
ncbi:TetR/AcrR family transcriptional regulator [Micrococcus terreus]|uniref:Transcriptional regulator, TetR family n=1 Tax=Micrococcus terreus TaxID=574650 RepID=A0A1I7MPT7_9MICC|nr:TetR/AcrR family transcriptional regulator C-terminal domain-containing protein [Micrococcus terreus]SFV23932.1 transcriptional regulator, TetR family [Micrococcus terreus]